MVSLEQAIRVERQVVVNMMLIRLKRFGVRVPKVLWRRIIDAEARRGQSRIEWFTEDHHRVRDFVVTEIARTGDPVGVEQVTATLGISKQRALAIIEELEKGMTFLFRTDGDAVDWAYPVTATRTPHRVQLDSGERFFAAWGIDAIAVPFVQGQLLGRTLEAEISTLCRCCDRPLQLSVGSDLSYRILSDKAEPVISVPSVNIGKLEDPSIIHDFWMRSHFFWSEEHASNWGHQIIGAYPTLPQATVITDISQSALFSFPRDPSG